MTLPWFKVYRNILSDEKIAFLMRRYGHETFTFWMGLMSKVDPDTGIFEKDEDVLADLCQIEEKRFHEIRGIFIKYGLVSEVSGGKLSIIKWKEYQQSESTERVRQFRERQRAARLAESALPSGAAPSPLPESTEPPRNDETLPKRDGNGSETTDIDIDLDVDREKEYIHTPREEKTDGRSEGIPRQGSEPSSPPGESAMPRAVFDAWGKLGDGVYQPGDYATVFAARWGELRRFVRGIHSNDVLAAVANLGRILGSPPGTYYWSQRITLQTFLEKHLEKFLPGNFREEDFLLRRQPRTTPTKRKTRAELEKLRAAHEAVYGEAEATQWFERELRGIAV
jgi:hypothetical protein